MCWGVESCDFELVAFLYVRVESCVAVAFRAESLESKLWFVACVMLDSTFLESSLLEFRLS